jgi:hypothetical protein
MTNWNYEDAKQYINSSIEDEITKTMTRVFLDQLAILVLQHYAAPESEFD